jgi:hypothetical protein
MNVIPGSRPLSDNPTPKQLASVFRDIISEAYELRLQNAGRQSATFSNQPFNVFDANGFLGMGAIVRDCK